MAVSDRNIPARQPPGVSSGGPAPSSPPPAPLGPSSRGPGSSGAGRLLRSGPARPRWQHRPATGLLVLLCLVVAAPVLLVEVQRPDVVDRDEARTLATSLQTWQQFRKRHSLSVVNPDRLAPVYNGQPQLYAPPGMTWVHLLALSLHPPATPAAAPDVAALDGRLASAAFGLLAVLGVFWAGRCIGDNRTALFAALVLAAMPAFLFAAHQATSPIAHAGLSAIAVAAALWAIRPLKTPPSLWRQALGWLTCGLALAGTLLVAGPIAILTTALPILLLLILCPGRLSHLLGLVAALLIAFVLLLPWILHVHEQDSMAWRHWLVDLLAPASQSLSATLHQMLNRLGLLAILVLPWTLWLLGALVQPFSQSSKGTRPRLFLGWVWLVATAMILTVLPGASSADLLVPVLPAAAVLIAQLFTQYIDLAGAGRYAKFWRRLRWPHTALLLAISVGLPIVLHAPPDWAQPYLAPLVWMWALAAGLVLLAIQVLALRWMLQDYPDRCLLAWTAWTLVASLLVAFPLTQGPAAQSPARADGRNIAGLTRGAATFWLSPTRPQGPAQAPDPSLVFYTGQPMPQLAAGQLTQALAQQDALFLLAPPQALAALHVPAQVRLELPRLGRALFACSAPVPASRPMTMPDAAPRLPQARHLLPGPSPTSSTRPDAPADIRNPHPHPTTP